MIYRHYKGGLYFVIGYANPISHDFPAESIEHIAVARYTEAKTPMEDEPISVLLVHDKSTGNVYYAHDSIFINGALVFYKDLKGKYWLRPMSMFFEDTDIGEPRFKKMSGEDLFDILSARKLDKQ